MIAKQKGGQLKVRLVHDLRRSGVNEKVVVQERVVLPRATDVVCDALDLMELHGTPEVEYFVLDFKDAFKQLTIAPVERKYLGGEALGGFFVYTVLVFGIKSGPLIWGRVAALLMRLLQPCCSMRPLGSNALSMTPWRPWRGHLKCAGS